VTGSELCYVLQVLCSVLFVEWLSSCPSAHSQKSFRLYHTLISTDQLGNKGVCVCVHTMMVIIELLCRYCV